MNAKKYRAMSKFRRQLMIANTGAAPKPYDAEIEYLQSSGTQYIATNVTPVSTNGFEIHFQQTYIGDTGSSLFGSRHYNGSSYSGFFQMLSVLRNGTRIWRLDYNANNNIGGNINSNDNVFILSADGKLTLNGVLQATISMASFTTYPIYVFACNQDGTAIFPHQGLRIKSLKVGSVLDLKPVRVGQVGYMYDRVSGQLFGNAGTGNFILGNDKN